MKKLITLIIFCIILATHIGIWDIIIFTIEMLGKTAPILFAIAAYLLKQQISFKKEYREGLLKSKWIIQQNSSFLRLHTVKNTYTKELIEKLELVPPYLGYYSSFIDNSIRSNLIEYNTEITNLKLQPNYEKFNFNKVFIIQNDLIQSINGQIHLLDNVLSNPFTFYLLPLIIKFITNKFFNNITPKNNNK